MKMMLSLILAALAIFPGEAADSATNQSGFAQNPELRKRMTALFAEKHPDLDPKLRAQMESGEVAITNGIHEYFGAKKAALDRELAERKAKATVALNQYLQAHDDLKPEIRSAMKAGKLCVGMTTEEVEKVLWWPPDEKTATTDARGEHAVWDFSQINLVVRFEDGKVESWTKTQRAAAKKIQH